MKTFEDYLEIAGGFTAADNSYLKEKQDAEKRRNPVNFTALYDDMWEILGEDDSLHGDVIEDDSNYAPLRMGEINGSVTFTGTMDEFEEFFASRGITGDAFDDWFNNSTERIYPDFSKLGSNPKKERRPIHTRGANSYLKSIR